MIWSNVGGYAKGVTAVSFAVATSLQHVYGAQPWFTGLLAGLGALSVILIPNQSKSVTPVKDPKDGNGQPLTAAAPAPAEPVKPASAT